MKNLDAWKELTPSQIKEVINNYIDKNMKLNKAGEKYNLNGSQVRNLLSTYKIKQRRKAPDNRKYKINDFYFDTQSSNMAYIMGFWAADGNISKDENRLDLELSKEDYEILEKIREELSCERPIKVYQCANGYIKNKLLFWSKHIKETFLKYGIVPNKTYSENFQPPYKLDKKYWIDYIRGFFDGDGCIKKGTSLSFEINSTNLDILKSFQQYFLENYNIQLSISTTGMKGRNIPMYRLYCLGEKTRRIFNILYTPNSLFLQRKYKRWLEFI